MKKKIAKVIPAAFGHLMLEFEDATKHLVGPAARHQTTTTGRTGRSRR